MGFDALFGLLPYGPKWRRQRRVFHQHFDSKVISRHHPTMASASVDLAKDMLSAPERFADHTRK
jgi:cytochrome P450